MKSLSTFLLFLLIFSNASGQKLALDSNNRELIGSYHYCATFDDNWKMVKDDDSIAHKSFLLRGCADLTIAKIDKKDTQFLTKDWSHYLSDSNIFKGLYMFVGCKGHRRYMFSEDRTQLELGNHVSMEEVKFIDEDMHWLGHFIYIGIKVDEHFLWFKYVKD